MNEIMYGEDAFSKKGSATQPWQPSCTHHFIVVLRLGWLTVLSSRNMVEHELYFLVSCPGDT